MFSCGLICTLTCWIVLAVLLSLTKRGRSFTNRKDRNNFLISRFKLVEIYMTKVEVWWNISALKYMKTSWTTFNILLICVITLYQLYPTIFKHREICSFNQGNGLLHVVRLHINGVICPLPLTSQPPAKVIKRFSPKTVWGQHLFEDNLKENQRTWARST